MNSVDSARPKRHTHTHARCSNLPASRSASRGQFLKLLDREQLNSRDLSSLPTFSALAHILLTSRSSCHHHLNSIDIYQSPTHIIPSSCRGTSSPRSSEAPSPAHPAYRLPSSPHHPAPLPPLHLFPLHSNKTFVEHAKPTDHPSTKYPLSSLNLSSRAFVARSSPLSPRSLTRLFVKSLVSSSLTVVRLQHISLVKDTICRNIRLYWLGVEGYRIVPVLGITWSEVHRIWQV